MDRYRTRPPEDAGLPAASPSHALAVAADGDALSPPARWGRRRPRTAVARPGQAPASGWLDGLASPPSPEPRRVPPASPALRPVPLPSPSPDARRVPPASALARRVPPASPAARRVPSASPEPWRALGAAPASPSSGSAAWTAFSAASTGSTGTCRRASRSLTPQPTALGAQWEAAALYLYGRGQLAAAIELAWGGVGVAWRARDWVGCIRLARLPAVWRPTAAAERLNLVALLLDVAAHPSRPPRPERLLASARGVMRSVIARLGEAATVEGPGVAAVAMCLANRLDGVERRGLWRAPVPPPPPRRRRVDAAAAPVDLAAAATVGAVAPRAAEAGAAMFAELTAAQVEAMMAAAAEDLCD